MGRQTTVDRGAEFISAAAYLVWLKSKMLLPSHEQSQDPVDKYDYPHFEVIHHLMDYCRFKKAAKELGERQEKQQACYFRGIESPEWKKPMGIDHVSLDDLAQLFKEMMGRAVQTKLQIHEENWRVSDKIHLIRNLMQEREMFPLEQLFPLINHVWKSLFLSSHSWSSWKRASWLLFTSKLQIIWLLLVGKTIRGLFMTKELGFFSRRNRRESPFGSLPNRS